MAAPTKYTDQTRRAIHELADRGLGATEIAKRLANGNGGVPAIEVPRRTVAHIAAEQRRRQSQPQRPWPSYWNVIRMIMALKGAGVDTSKLDELDPEDVAGMIDWPARYVAALLARREAWATHAPAPTGPPPDETERERELEEEVADWSRWCRRAPVDDLRAHRDVLSDLITLAGAAGLNQPHRRGKPRCSPARARPPPIARG